MDYLLIVLRVLHVVGGIVWVGAAILMNSFILPTAAATQDAGQQFMRHLMGRTRITATMTTSALLTVLAGFALMGRDAGAGSAWIRSGPGIGYSVGAVFALIGFVAGMLTGMTTGKLGRLGAEVKGQPTAEQAAQLNGLRKRLTVVGPINFYSLVIAAVLMAVARYLAF